VLDVLREGRFDLASGFLGESPDLFEPMFLYSSGSVAMELAVSKYIYRWVDSHLEVFNKRLSQLTDDEHGLEDASRLFLETYRTFCERFLKSKEMASGERHKSIALETLLKIQIKQTEKLADLDLRTTEKIRKLRYEHTKGRALFDREFKRLAPRIDDGI